MMRTLLPSRRSNLIAPERVELRNPEMGSYPMISNISSPNSEMGSLGEDDEDAELDNPISSARATMTLSIEPYIRRLAELSKRVL